MTIVRKAVLSLLAFLIASASLLMAQGTYTQIDYPGADNTFCTGINTAGDVVGAYFGSDLIRHGFLLSGGVFTTIDFPDSVDTQLSGINDVGQIVGVSSESFVYDIPTRVFTKLEYPGGGVAVVAAAINNAGTIGGFLVGFNNAVAFELNGTEYTKIKLSGHTATEVLALNNIGEALLVATGDYYLLNQGGIIRKLNFVPGAFPAGIDNADDIVGRFYRRTERGLEGAAFVKQGATREILRFPGSRATSGAAINDRGVVAGSFIDPDTLTITHGFIWTPDTAPVK